MQRHRGYVAINITGLAVGMAACLLLFLVIRYETGFDKFQPNYKRIGRVVTSDKFGDNLAYSAGVPVPALDALRVDMPDIKFSGILSCYGSQVTIGEDAANSKKFIEETGMFFCEPAFFDIFQYSWIQGSPDVLKEPNTVVLTRKMAIKYFGQADQVVGKLIKLDNAVAMKVSGVLEDIPDNTDFPLGVLISMETVKRDSRQYNYYPNWNSSSSNFQIYALMPEQLSASQVDDRLKVFSKKHYAGIGNSIKTNFLQPLEALHFDRRFEVYGDHTSSKASLLTLTLIGIFIIIMACINFINLSTAQAVARSKEVGIRKVLGSSRKQLFLQVMIETALVVIVSGFVAVVIAYFSMPYIKHISSIPESSGLFNIQAIAFMALVMLTVTLVAGFYPSLVLSAYKPVIAIKNKMQSAKVAGISLRRGLVVLQFAISQVLIIGTIVAISQMNFIQHSDLGFDKEAVLILSGNSDSTNVAKLPSFRQQLMSIPSVKSVSFSSDVPSSENTWSSNFAFDHREDETFQMTMKFADEAYFKTFGLELSAGRIYSASDTMHEVMINETAVQKLGLKNSQEAVGKEIRLGRSPWKMIVGVVKDFKTNSLREQIKPLLIAQRKEYYSLISVKLRSSNFQKTQASIQSAWNSQFPEYAYDARFFEDNINRFYEQEEKLALLYKIFAILAILISSLGLYGLVSYMAVQKTKEVGIRKVLGASAGSIVYLFSKEFTILIAIAFLIAAPLAYFMMNNWLQDFVYRIQLGVGVFLIAVLISIIIALATVGYKAVKAALANPVKSLRSE